MAATADQRSRTASTAILLGRNDVRDVRAGLVDADGRGRPGRAVLQRDQEVRRLGHARPTRPGTTPRSSAPTTPERIKRLKDEVDGDLFVSGSTTLVRALLADGLVDGLHVFLYPLTRGEGERLFDGVPAINFTCEASETFSHGMTYLHYRPRNA